MRRSKTVFLFTLILFSGCTTLEEKFTSDEKVNLEPFATTTINMVNTIDYSLERDVSILTKPYLNAEDKPALKRLYELDDELYRVLRGIVGYSIKLVTLSSSSRTDKEMVEAFADYVANLDKPALEFHIQQGNVTEQDFQDILESIRQQEDLLDAMRSAQPMIEFILQHVDTLTNEIKHQEVKAAKEIDKAIDRDYVDEIAYVEMLVARRKIALQALVSVDEHYKGKRSGLKRLNQANVLQRLGLTKRKITNLNIKRAEQELIKELAGIQSQLDMLEKDYDFYLKVHQELDELVKFHDEEVRKAKGIIQLWSNAHTKMANGVTDPADWFDVTDPGGELFGLVKSAIKR